MTPQFTDMMFPDFVDLAIGGIDTFMKEKSRKAVVNIGIKGHWSRQVIQLQNVGNKQRGHVMRYYMLGA